MKITLSPQAAEYTTKILVSDQIISVDGQVFDMSLIPVNSQVIAEYPATGIIKNVDGEIQLTIIYKYQDEHAVSQQSKDINDYIFTVGNSACPCPIAWKQTPKPTCVFNPKNQQFEITAYSIYDHPKTMGNLQHDDGQTFRTWSVSSEYESAINEWALVSGLTVEDAEEYLSELITLIDVQDEKLEVQENV